MVTINIGRKEMVFFSVVVLIFVVAGFAIAEWDSAKVMFHDSVDVKVTIDGVDYSLQNSTDLGLMGGGMKFGAWVSKSAASPYEALTDGIVVASAARDDQSYVRGYIGDTSGSLAKVVFAGGWDINNVGSITMPVKKGNFWKVEARGTEILIYWIPILSSGGSSGGTLDNCAWTSYGVCGAASGGTVSCSTNKVMNALDSVGCSEGGCADVTRCEKTRVMCCDIV